MSGSGKCTGSERSIRSGSKSSAASAPFDTGSYLKRAPTPLHNYYNDQWQGSSEKRLLNSWSSKIFGSKNKRLLPYPPQHIPSVPYRHPISSPFHLVPESYSLLIKPFVPHSVLISNHSFPHTSYWLQSQLLHLIRYYHWLSISYHIYIIR